LASNEEGVDWSAEDFVDKLWLLSITLPLIKISARSWSRAASSHEITFNTNLSEPPRT